VSTRYDVCFTNTGLLSLREIFVTDDLRSYAYTAYYQVSSLFVSDGSEKRGSAIIDRKPPAGVFGIHQIRVLR
jgi:hypothetical protein